MINADAATKVLVYTEAWTYGGIESFLMSVLRLLSHDEYDAQNQSQRGQCGRLKELEEGSAAGSVQIEQADDLACDSRTDICADDDTQRLVQGDDAGADQTGGDDDGGSGGLDDSRYQQPEEECLDRRSRHLFHDLFQHAG